MLLYALSIGPAVWLIFHVHLPDWTSVGVHYFFCPLSWALAKSEQLTNVVVVYMTFWVDITSHPATQNVQLPEAPPFFVEVSGTLIGAWLIWNFVRWVNQRKTLSTPQVAP